MEVHVSIGQNRRFELHDALLIYGDRQESFVTRHSVSLCEDASPALGPAQPLTVTFLESLVRSLYGGLTAEILPANILAKGDRMVAWWTSAQRRQMFYESAAGKAANLNGRTFSSASAGLVRRWWRTQDPRAARKYATGRGDHPRGCSLLEPLGRRAGLHGDHAAAGRCLRSFDERMGARFLRECVHPRERRRADAP